MSQSRLVLIGIDAASSALVREWLLPGSSDDRPPAQVWVQRDDRDTVWRPRRRIWPTFLSGTSPASHGMFSHLKLKPRTYGLEVGMYAIDSRCAVLDASEPCGEARSVDRRAVRPAYQKAERDPRHELGRPRPVVLPRSSCRRASSGSSSALRQHPVDTCDAKGRSLKSTRIYGALDRASRRRQRCSGIASSASAGLLFRSVLGVPLRSHQFWHFMDPRHPQHDRKASEALRSTIRDSTARSTQA